MKSSKAKKKPSPGRKKKSKSKSKTPPKSKNASRSPKNKSKNKPRRKSPRKGKSKSPRSKSPKTPRKNKSKSPTSKNNKNRPKSKGRGRSKSPKSPDGKGKKPKGKKNTSKSKSPKNGPKDKKSKSKSPNRKNKSKSPTKRKNKSKSPTKRKNKSKSPTNGKNKSKSPKRKPKSKSKTPKKHKKGKPGEPIETNSSRTDVFRRPPSEPPGSQDQVPPKDAGPRKRSVEFQNDPLEGGDLQPPPPSKPESDQEPEPATEPKPEGQQGQGQGQRSPRNSDGVLPPESQKRPSLVGREPDPNDPSQFLEPASARRRSSSLKDKNPKEFNSEMLIPSGTRGLPGISGYNKNRNSRDDRDTPRHSRRRTVGEVIDKNRRASQSSAGSGGSSDRGGRRRSSGKSGRKGSQKDDGVFDVTVYERKHSSKPTFTEHKAHLITPHTLYKEALYTSVHYLGVPTVRFPSTKEDLCLYSHVVFRASPKDQVSAMEHVVGEAFPLTVINTNVRRAEGVEARDNNLLPDPYCIVAVDTHDTLADFSVDKPEWEKIGTGTPLRSKVQEKQKLKNESRPPPEKRLNQVYAFLPSDIKTSVQPQTKKPEWNQRFQCLALRPSVDVLSIELWDNETDPVTSGKPRGRRGSKGQGSDIFIGKVSLLVNEVPCEGESKWHFIQGTTHRKKEAEGRLLLEVWLTHAYRHGKNYEEYGEARIVLEMLWDHILRYESLRFSGEWNGDIPPAATCLIFQYALQTGISEASQAIVRWNAYAKYNLGLFAVERRLTELENALERARDWKDVRECELEGNMTLIVIEKVLPVIRNHLFETQEKVHEAVKAITHCREILNKFQCKASVFQVQFLIEAEIRMAALEWYQAKHIEYLGNSKGQGQGHNTFKASDRVECLARLLNEVNTLLRQCLLKWKPLFWMDGMVDYMPLVYDEFHKMIIHDVEVMCWSTLQHYDTNAKLRQVLVNLDSDSRRLCRALFDLYVQTQVFVLDQQTVFELDKETTAKGKNAKAKSLEERFLHMNRYHRWFRPVLVLWLGYALIKASDMISTSIRIDNVIVENETLMTSSSAADAGLVYHQLSTFWQQLNWPDIAEGYVILHYLFEVMCFVTIMYARLKRSKLEKEGYFDTEGRFDISTRLCTALNNIEYVKESLIKIPDDTKMDTILLDLDAALGESYARTHRVRISNLLTGTLVHIEVQFKKILNGVGDRARPEIRERFHECFLLLQDPQKTDDDTLVPVLSYLEDNILVLHKSLLELNFIRVLQMFWNVTCQEMQNRLSVFVKEQDARSHGPFFQRVENIIGILIVYFEGGGGGLNEMEIDTKHYKALKLFLSCLSLPTEALIGAYYRGAAEEQMEIKEPSKLGTLTVRVGYHMGTLSVEVLSAKNLSARDEPLPILHWCLKQVESSDPQVEVALMPPNNFKNVQIRSRKTDIKWKTQQPVFNEKFNWQLAEADCTQPESVLVFTVRDFDQLSRDDFLGQAIVPIGQMPGLLKYKPVPQPMHLQLQSVDAKRNPILSILANRSWDSHARSFASEQEKYVIAIKDQKGEGAPLRLARGSGS